MEEQRNLDVIRRMAACWNAGDPEGALAFYSDDTVTETTSDWLDAGPWRGKDEHRAAFEQWRGPWDSLELHIHELRAFADRVLARAGWTTRGRLSGANQQLEFHAVFTLRDGHITQTRFFNTAAEAEAALKQTPQG